RRHTRFSRDWSSDVCSSDLWPQIYAGSVDCGRDGSDARELVRRAETALGHAVAAREPWVEWQESLELGTDVQLVRLFRESRAEEGGRAVVAAVTRARGDAWV